MSVAPSPADRSRADQLAALRAELSRAHIARGPALGFRLEAIDDRLADGFVKAIETVGAVLAEHFPVTSGDTNELDDHLVEI